MKLNEIYNFIVKKGIQEDIRSAKEIETLLKNIKKDYEALPAKQKETFDTESLSNPFSDTRILNGNPDAQIKNVAVGIDIEGPELLLIDRLKDKGINIDLALAHHPEGPALAGLYKVMDLQIDAYIKEGVSVSVAENNLIEKKTQVERSLNAANYQRSVDIAKLLGINYMCAHTPADNCSFQYVKKLIEKEKPSSLGGIIDLLCAIPEYLDAAKNNNSPKIAIGSPNSRASRVHIEFTGGTEGPSAIYAKLSSLGIDTIIAMHQSEEHLKKCRESHINVIFASHIASDTLGINLLLDSLEKKEKLKVYELSGFRRFVRK